MYRTSVTLSCSAVEGTPPLHASLGDIGADSYAPYLDTPTPPEVSPVTYACSAVQGFIALSVNLQDVAGHPQVEHMHTHTHTHIHILYLC